MLILGRSLPTYEDPNGIENKKKIFKYTYLIVVKKCEIQKRRCQSNTGWNPNMFRTITVLATTSWKPTDGKNRNRNHTVYIEGYEAHLVARSSTPEFFFRNASIFFFGRNASTSIPSSLARFTSSWVRYNCARSSTIEEGPTPSIARCFFGITDDSVSHPNESTRLDSLPLFSTPFSAPSSIPLKPSSPVNSLSEEKFSWRHMLCYILPKWFSQQDPILSNFGMFLWWCLREETVNQENAWGVEAMQIKAWAANPNSCHQRIGMDGLVCLMDDKSNLRPSAKQSHSSRVMWVWKYNRYKTP